MLSKYYANESLYSDIDIKKAYHSLSEVICCKTISYEKNELFNNDEFIKLQNIIKKYFPRVFSLGEVKMFDKSMLIKLTGKNKDLKPVLLMAHQDVVYASEEDWSNPPFSGIIDDEYIWGRGSQDIKCLLLAHLNACEYFLQNNTLTRTIYLSFGHDEEVGGFNGTKKIVEYLKENDVELEVVLDEGFGFIDYGTKYGVKDKLIGEIGVYEKGYLDMKIDVSGNLGHSSNPFTPSSLELLSNVINVITKNPLEAKLSDVVLSGLEEIKPFVELEPLRTYLELKDIENIKNYFLKDKSLNIYAKTTIAPTMIEGGSKLPNVLPGNMSANINFRLNFCDSSQKVFDYYNNLINDSRVKLSSTRTIEPSKISSIDSQGYICIKQALNSMYKDVIFIPSVTTCATDSRYFSDICETVLRIYPFLNDLNLGSGIHGIDERISKRGYIQGIKVLIKFIELIQKG